MEQLPARERLIKVAEDIGPRAVDESHENLSRFEKALQWIEPSIEKIERPTTVDIGCGLGAIDCALALGKPANMFGLDRFVWETKSDSNHFGMTQAEHDSAKAAWEKYRFKIYEADIGGQWPFENDFADLTISNAVFEHLNGTHKLFLQETFRVLKPGGIFFMSTPNIASILKRIRFLIGRSPNWELKDFYQSGEKFTGHTREFTVKECVQMVEWAGFEIIRSAAVPTYGKWKWIRSPKKWPSLIAFALGHLSSTFGDHVFILAKKPR